MKVKYIIIILLVLFLAWNYLFKQPSITIVSVDKTNKMATLKIGNKTIYYKNNIPTGQTFQIQLGYSVLIQPTGGSSNYASIFLKKNDDIVNTKTISFLS
jgi:hypothetical protein